MFVIFGLGWEGMLGERFGRFVYLGLAAVYTCFCITYVLGIFFLGDFIMVGYVGHITIMGHFNSLVLKNYKKCPWDTFYNLYKVL